MKYVFRSNCGKILTRRKRIGEKPLQVPLYTSQIPCGLAKDRKFFSALAMTWPWTGAMGLNWLEYKDGLSPLT
jgi:hypothetical protein